MSWAYQVSVEAPKFTAVISRGRPAPVVINGNPASNTARTLYNANGIEVERAGGRVYVHLNAIGIRASWDGYSALIIKTATGLRNQLCGLCGTYNGNRNDDFRTRAGTVVGSPTTFGNSWEVPNSCGNVGKRQTQPPLPQGCSTNTTFIQLIRDECSIIQTGVLKRCNGAVDPTQYIDDCVLDLSCTDEAEHDAFYCSLVGRYAEDCADAGVTVSNWRNPICRKLTI